MRLHEFLEPVNPRAAALAVRRILIGDYEMRYELTARDVFVLQIFHTREDR